MEKIETLDYKKKFKDLYMPKTEPSLITVPPIPFLMIDGKGNPNDNDGEYQHAVELLYAISYTIKMSTKNGFLPAGYFAYVVPPLEGLWWLEDYSTLDFTQKDLYFWTSMIRLPEFVTKEVFEWALSEVEKKKPQLDTTKVRYELLEEGLCVQVMHHGPYDEEPVTLDKIETFNKEQGLKNDIGTLLPDGRIRRHHEIYLSDPRKTKPESMRTILRHPVRYER
jgi:hypothetical protein